MPKVDDEALQARHSSPNHLDLTSLDSFLPTLSFFSTDSDLLSSSVLIIPGGPASSKMSQNSRLQNLLKTAHQDKTLVAFICAGTLSALTSGVGNGGPITSHPSVKEDLEKGRSKYEMKRSPLAF